MEFIHNAWHLMQSFLQPGTPEGQYARDIILSYRMWIYAVLFLIVFCETGLVVTPFLPGDSLLFAAGTFTSMGMFDLATICLLLSAAAILGDTLNYWIGSLVGPKIFHKENVRLLNKEHLHRAHRFYERFGGITIVLARFMPIIRTFAPFVAGIGKMTYWRFLAFNAAGGTAWILTFVLLGYFFGSQPLVKKNFSLVIVAIVVISVMPGVIEYVRQKRKARRDRQAA